MTRYNLSSASIRAHREVNAATECPGDRFPIDRVTANLRSATSASSAPLPSSSSDDR
jgi:hypothetical protein